MTFFANNLVISMGIAISILIVVVYVVLLVIAMKSIFANSGSPISMSQALLSSFHVLGQIFFGILAVIIIAVLMENKVVSSDAGLPIFSAIVAYLLGKGYKDINFKQENKNKE